MAAKRALYRWFYDNIHCHYYDLVTRWCFLPLGGEAKVRREMVDAIGLEKGDKVLDMCCGTGSTTCLIAERVGGDCHVEAIDLSTGQVRIAKRKNRAPNIDFMVMDASHTCFDEGSFDKVVIPHALHEMPKESRLAVLREAGRVTEVGGTVAALEMDRPPGNLRRVWLGIWWFYWLPFNPETPTRRDMLKRGLAEEMKEAGLTDVTRIGLFAGALQVVKGRKAPGGSPTPI